MKCCNILLILFLFELSCSKEDIILKLNDVDISKSENGIVSIPKGLHSDLEDVFSKYTKIVAKNGRSIHIFAQGRVSDAKLVRARQIMQMYLTPVLGSKYGAHKFFVANSMADRNATLFFFDTEQEYNRVRESYSFDEIFNWQDLYATESFVEGSGEYIRGPRDATYEEILHLVQDYGITPMLPLYQKEIDDATDNAVSKGWYSPDGELPILDYDQEYFATLWDAYLGVPSDQMTNKNREEIKNNDPSGYEIIKGFLPEYLTYNALIDEKFKGNFYLKLNPNEAYTNKSRYLIKATLTGSLNSGLIGNDRNNYLRGNQGNNMLKGNEGNDKLDGDNGMDKAEFTGNSSEYVITKNSSKTIVKDKVSNRDGIDTLLNIEKIVFKDKTIDN